MFQKPFDLGLQKLYGASLQGANCKSLSDSLQGHLQIELFESFQRRVLIENRIISGRDIVIFFKVVDLFTRMPISPLISETTVGKLSKSSITSIKHAPIRAGALIGNEYGMLTPKSSCFIFT